MECPYFNNSRDKIILIENEEFQCKTRIIKERKIVGLLVHFLWFINTLHVI